MSEYCAKCGVSFLRAALTALLIDAGARSNVDPSECPEGGDHEWREAEKTKPGDAA